jgi:hypothetical protein
MGHSRSPLYTDSSACILSPFSLSVGLQGSCFEKLVKSLHPSTKSFVVRMGVGVTGGTSRMCEVVGVKRIQRRSGNTTRS